MIVYCTNCHLVYESSFGKGFNPPPGMIFGVQGFVSKCPRCGFENDASGEYEVGADGIISLLKKLPPIAQEGLRNLTEKAIENNYSTDEFKNEVANLGFNLSFLEKLVPKERITDFLMFILALLTYIHEKSEPKTIITNNTYYTTEAKPESKKPKTKKVAVKKKHKPRPHNKKRRK